MSDKMKETLNLPLPSKSRSKSPFDPTVKFEDLNDSLKAKISKATVNFQGVKTTIFDIIGYDNYILDSLTSRDITTILSTDKALKIGEICKTSSKYNYIERKFIENKFNAENDTNVNFTKTFDQIEEEILTKKTFILADSPGSGKTTVFRYMTKKLKDNFINCWVCYIKLGKHVEVIETYNNLGRDLTIEEIRNFLLDILNLKSELEIEILTKLFFNDRIILLFDEIDEVGAKFNNFVLKLLFALKNSTRNQMWISSRSKFGKRISDSLNVTVHTFSPLIWDEKKEFISEILKNLKVYNEKSRYKLLDDFEKILINSENRDDCSKIFNNLFMIEATVELYVEENTYFWSDSFTLYGTFNKFVMKQHKKVDANFKIEKFSEEFTQMNVYQVFALKLLIGDYYNEKYALNFENLAIMKQWENEKFKWTFEKIHRYGLLTIDLDDPKCKMDSMEFVRKTYAEFFIAEFLISFMFYQNHHTNYECEECGNILKIFKLVLLEDQDFEMTRNFIYSFILRNVNSQRLPIQNEMRTEILKNIFKIHKENLEFVYDTGSLSLLENWSKFLVNEHDLLMLLWHVGKKQNFLVKLLFKDDRRRRLDFQELLEVTSRIFGPDWHKVFNKKRLPLIIDEDIGNIERNEDPKFKGFNRNLIKFLDLVDKNYELSEKQLIFKEYVSYFRIVRLVKEETFLKIVTKGYHIFNNTDGIAEIFAKFLKHSTDLDVLICIGDKIEIFLTNEPRAIRRVIFGTFQNDLHPLVTSLKSKNLRLFRVYRILYTKYKIIWKELQDILLNTNDTIPEILQNMTDEIFPEFQNFISQMFIRNEGRLKDLFENYSSFKKPYRLKCECEKYFKPFLRNLFEGDNSKVEAILPKFFKYTKSVDTYENLESFQTARFQTL